MPRKKISEFRAKTILAQELGLPYTGLALDVKEDWQAQLAQLPKDARYVLKVDQAVKARFKQGLVLLDQPAAALPVAVQDLAGRGFRYFVVEPYQKYPAQNEKYLSITRQRDANVAVYSAQGGIDVERQTATLKHVSLATGAPEVDHALGLPDGTMAKLNRIFDANHFAFLEINPLLVIDGRLHLLDAAVEVDSEAAALVGDRWSMADFRTYAARAKTPEELVVEELASQSQASFRLEVLNPNGQIFLLLSGGGASVALADEVKNQGFGQALGNYGEYSGNPTKAETYLYAKQIISLMLKSTATPKTLILAGAVANFTDVRVTFQGIIQALEESKVELRRQNIKVFVRRGGPYETEGLEMMRRFLEQEKLLGVVCGPELILSDIVALALEPFTARVAA